MSIHVHKTGLVKTLGQQSDAIVTDANGNGSSNLTGEWRPGVGVSNNHKWDNQVSGGYHLGRNNELNAATDGVDAESGPPAVMDFDGDDWLGARANDAYEGIPFSMDTSNAFTVAQWFKNKNGIEHVAFCLHVTTGTVAKLIVSQSGGTANKAKLTVGAETPVEFDYTFADNTWYYISLVYDGSNDWSFFVYGSFVGSATIANSGLYGSSGTELLIGRDAGTSTYSGGTIKLGHVHVYDLALKNSQLRQNFLASHSINNSRTYGATYTA
jgi:hypothetical protein